ncbi:MAG: hypothetical protein L6428_12470 [Candidatus Aminicenantes bacterium]|nr:hypothetical protein [Acidobacteriota bacterium]MCG2812247.1 hypothetical protein [Candidatus Aminicenantes bacterium]
MLNLTELQKSIELLIMDSSPPEKHCARSAIKHIKKAWDIREIDKEMACFRAITGEEESVSAIFHSLKKRKYFGAEKLKPRNHVHKAAFHPFCIAVSQSLTMLNEQGREPTIELKEENGIKRFHTRLTMKMPDGHTKWAYPLPPLHYNVKVNEELHDFSEELMNIASERNAADIISVIKKEANCRNRILYASDAGIPSIPDSLDDFLMKKKEVIFLNLIIFLMIDPYHEKQLFVQQALQAFLKMLNIIDKVDIEAGW